MINTIYHKVVTAGVNSIKHGIGAGKLKAVEACSSNACKVTVYLADTIAQKEFCSLIPEEPLFPAGHCNVAWHGTIKLKAPNFLIADFSTCAVGDVLYLCFIMESE